jgi:hypothetical protein
MEMLLELVGLLEMLIQLGPREMLQLSSSTQLQQQQQWLQLELVSMAMVM